MSVFVAQRFAFTGVISGVAVLIAGAGIVVNVLTNPMFGADAVVVAVTAAVVVDVAAAEAAALLAVVAARSAAMLAVLVAPIDAPFAVAVVAVAATAVAVAAAVGPHWRWLWRWWRSLRLLCA